MLKRFSKKILIEKVADFEKDWRGAEKRQRLLGTRVFLELWVRVEKLDRDPTP